MITKKSIFIIPLIAGLLSVASCNSDDDYEYEMIDYSGVAITGFSLQEDDDILNNLDSVFFTIDLVNSRIFNADSLPYGTKVNELAVTITSDLCDQLIISSPGEDGVEEIDYITSPNEKIDFSRGAVDLKIVSGDGEYSRNYKIYVNVHQLSPDSLYWASVNEAQLPTVFDVPVSQKSVRMADKAYCLTTDGDAFCMAVSDDPFANQWSKVAVSLPSDTDVRTFTATDNQLYILAGGNLLQSADGVNWTACNETWRSITGSYGDILLGVKESPDGNCYHAFFPDGNYPAEQIDADFPVAGNSGCVTFDSKWSSSPQIMTFGGRNMEGEFTGATWAFDGNSWVKLSGNLPAGEGYAVSKYTVAETDTLSWTIKHSEVILAIGGNQYDAKDGMTVSREVYISRDYGMNWRKAYDDLQLPKSIPGMYNADLLVFDTTLSVGDEYTSRGIGWQELPLVQSFSPVSRAVTPITSWDCPYLYLMGGIDRNGKLQPKIRRGVVNSLRFRPLQ
ncbi:MAG: hypothetical protein HDS68_03250 [Bacteroidales bacterium]|nr:hypothetical protein [Bacteroidales bacterium]